LRSSAPLTGQGFGALSAPGLGSDNPNLASFNDGLGFIGSSSFQVRFRTQTGKPRAERIISLLQPAQHL